MIENPDDLKVKCEEYLNGWKRAKADFINYQKDEVKRFEIFVQFANEALLKDFVIVLDSLNLALATDEKNTGLQILKSQYEDILRKHGVEKIAVAVGDDFNPMHHESIGFVEIDKQAPPLQSGQVAEELEKGYTLHGKVIRPARVKLAK